MPTVRTRRIELIGLAALAMAGAPGETAWAQGKLDARYVATLAGIPVAKGMWLLDISENHYTAAANGRTTGILKIFSGGNGTVAARGTMNGGRLVSGDYASNLNTDKKSDEVRMAISGGNVKELVVEPPFWPAPDRVPVTEAHRKGVIDPMSAVLMAIPAKGDSLSPEACNRTLPIFDGRGRFDLVLSFKRMDQVKADKGYQGQAVVCSVAYRPVSGHRSDRPAVKYLQQASDIEVWLAPVEGTRILVPFRVSVPTIIGPAVLQATQFVTNGQTQRPIPAAARPQQIGDSD